MQFKVNIKIEAILAEQPGWNNLYERKVLTELEDTIKKKVEEMVKGTIKRLQEDFQTDAMGLGEYLSQHHPKIWKEVKEDWEKGEHYFSKCEFDINVQLFITEPGSINRTTKPKR